LASCNQLGTYLKRCHNTNSEHMDIAKVNFMTSKVEEEEDRGEEGPNKDQKGLLDLPSTVKENHTESLLPPLNRL
jgi:hypothetical protein